MAGEDTPESYQFMPRLMGAYLLAAMAFMAVGKSLYIESLTFGLWCALLVHLFRRFGRKGAWALLSAPAALYWLWPIWVQMHPAGGEVYV
jgi:hypothetical protein